MTETEYLKKLEKSKEYRKRAQEKYLQKINSEEYKQKQHAKYLISIEQKRSKPHKPIKCKQVTARKGNKPYFSIFTEDMGMCYITGDTYNVVPHHIFEASNKAFSEKYGFILPLRVDWHEGYTYSIHTDRKLNEKYKRLCQEYWINILGKTKEEWLQECTRWY